MNTAANPDQLFGYDVMDNAGNKIGSVDNVWVDDATNAPEFVGVKTGWIFGHTHIIPVETAQVNDGAITVPFAEDQIKNAPSYPGDAELSPTDENNIYSYYGMARDTDASPTGLADDTGTYNTDTTTAGTGFDADTTADTDTMASGQYDSTANLDTDNEQQLTLSEEQLQVGKRQVEAGRVRLRKVVQTEHQEVPVDLRREQVTIERVDATDSTNLPGDAFQEEEIDVPVMREEAVVAKEAVVTGAVNVNKNVQSETRTVGGDVRSEDVVVEGDDAEDDIVSTSGLSTGNTTDTTNSY